MRDLKVSVLSLAILPALVVGAATAQVVDPTAFQPRNDAGLGSIKRSFNATQLTNVPGISCNGEPKACALTSAIWQNGRFWVFGREGWCCAQGVDTWVFEWTGDGTYIATHTIPIPLDTDDEDFLGGNSNSPAMTSPELRDVATDEGVGGDTVLVGTEEGVHVIRWNLAQGLWEITDQIVTANGIRTLPNTLIRGEGLSVLRILGTPELPNLPGVSPPVNREGEGYLAVAYDPAGDGGDGSMYVGADGGTIGSGQTGPPFQSGSVGSHLAFYDTNGDEIDWSWLARAQPNTPLNSLGQVSEHWVALNRNNLPILEIDMEGNILRTIVNNPITDVLDVEDLDDDGDTAEANPYFGEARGGWWAAGGITIDPITGNLWVGVDMQERLLEVDITTGMPTGLTIPQPEIGFLPARQGGITGLPGGDPGSYASSWDMIPFTNVAGDDFFTVIRMHQYPGLNGTTEAFLEGTINAIPLSGKIFNPATKPPIAYTSLSTLKIDLNANGGTPAPALLMFDLNDDVNTDAATTLALGLLPELRVHSAFSTPADNGLAFNFPWATGATLNLDLAAAGFVVNTGQQIRVQAVYFHPLSQYSPGLMVSNEIWFGGVGINQILVETTGANPENADTSSGYFRIHWLSGPDIVSVTLDGLSSLSNAGDLRDMHWDVTVANLADQMYLGNSTMPGARGTYRNSSDVLTGLVYDSAVNSNYGGNSPVVDYYVSSAAFTWDSGYQVILARHGNNPIYPGALQWNFTNFGLDSQGNQAAGTEIFEFDGDVDHMNGNTGDYFQGMVVEVLLSDGTMFKAEMLPDPEDSTRAFIGW